MTIFQSYLVTVGFSIIKIPHTQVKNVFLCLRLLPRNIPISHKIQQIVIIQREFAPCRDCSHQITIRWYIRDLGTLIFPSLALPLKREFFVLMVIWELQIRSNILYIWILWQIALHFIIRKQIINKLSTILVLFCSLS